MAPIGLGGRAILSTTHFVQPLRRLFMQLFADRGPPRIEKGESDLRRPRSAPPELFTIGRPRPSSVVEVGNQINALETYVIFSRTNPLF